MVGRVDRLPIFFLPTSNCPERAKAGEYRTGVAEASRRCAKRAETSDARSDEWPEPHPGRAQPAARERAIFVGCAPINVGPHVGRARASTDRSRSRFGIPRRRELNQSGLLPVAPAAPAAPAVKDVKDPETTGFQRTERDSESMASEPNDC